jgi:hypothetical protein
MGNQAQGMNYQHNMGIARAGLQQQQGLLSSFAQFGQFAMENPNMFKFGGGPSGAPIDGGAYTNGSWQAPIGPTNR